MTSGTVPIPTSQQHPAPASVSPMGRLLHGSVEKPRHQHHHHRRSGKYTHPYGGMRQFAEDRAGTSGWDHECLAIDNLESRKIARSNLADKISEIYKEEFVRVNKAEGKGRPKANNISAAKKTVRMIAERILLSLEAKATQHLFNEVIDKGKESEKELIQLRQIHKCGKENPGLTYDEIRAMASAKLNGLPEPLTLASVHGGSVGDMDMGDGLSLRMDTEEQEFEVEMVKQAMIEMRADQVARGIAPKLLSTEWTRIVSAACQRLVQESYSRQFVPKTKVYGCRHFTRKNRVLMVCCGTFPVCRMCHIQDGNRIHEVRIEPVQTMLCMMCGEVQPKTQNCRKCDVRFGSYYCDVCGITDDTPGYDLRHCEDCNVCMPGLTFHCNRCKSCVPATPEHEAVCNGIVNDEHDGTHAHVDSLDPESVGHGGGGGVVVVGGAAGADASATGGLRGHGRLNGNVSGERGGNRATGPRRGGGDGGSGGGGGCDRNVDEDAVDDGLVAGVGDARTAQLFSGL